jgi:endonuclease/exonuclease/phosphatase family metal-dependent hydrolase
MHDDAWRYLIEQLRPDVALVQEALFSAEPAARRHGQLFWSDDKGRDSGTAIFVRNGLTAQNIALRSSGSYIAGAEVAVSGVPILVASIHVGPPNYMKHLRALADNLVPVVGGRRFVVGGDLNAARHADTVYGGRRFAEFFEDLASREFHDCHWLYRQEEVPSFWGRQAQHEYQCDHLFVDLPSGKFVDECRIIDNSTVRMLSDHGPMQLRLNY